MNNVRKSVATVFAIVGIPLFVAGCSATRGYIGHVIVTEVELSQANFDVKKSVIGEASANYFFGIGPSKQDLLGRAKRDMLDRAQLRGSQAVVNVTTDIKETCFVIWYRLTATVSAEVVEFKE